jgi:NitT/TauT family transport system permease protein
MLDAQAPPIKSSKSLNPTNRGSDRLRRILVYVVIAVLIVLIWEGSKAVFALPDYKLPHLSQIGEAFMRPAAKGQFVWQILLYDAAYTMLEALTGFVIGGLVGFAFAVLFVHVPVARRGLLPFVIASQTVPIIAIAPMIVVGLGQLGAPPWIPKSAIAAYLTFFPVTINVLRGLESIDRDALALMKSYAATHLQIFTKLRLPNSTPYLFTALKIASTASVIGAIIGELPTGSKHGIGVQIINGAQTNTFNPGFLWATIVMASILGLLFYGAVALAEKLIVRWK